MTHEISAAGPAICRRVERAEEPARADDRADRDEHQRGEPDVPPESPPPQVPPVWPDASAAGLQPPSLPPSAGVLPVTQRCRMRVRDAAMLGAVPPTPAARSGPPGAGGSTPQAPKFQRPGWRLLFFVLALFAINFFVSRALVNQEVRRVRVPYSPTFLEQVRANNVVEITSKGTAIQGTFSKAVKYPPDAKKAKPTTRLQDRDPGVREHRPAREGAPEHGVTINAQPLDTGRAVVGDRALRLRADAALPRAR